MASNLTPAKVNQACAAQANGWEELLEKVLSGGQPEAHKKDERTPAMLRRAPRTNKKDERSTAMRRRAPRTKK